MNKYLVVIEGGNCMLRNTQENQVKKFGFFASRYVEAKDDKVAQELAMQIVKEELYSQNLIENSRFDPPTFVIDETRSVMAFTPSISTSGFTFYAEELKN
jgi:hypothetical protein